MEKFIKWMVLSFVITTNVIVTDASAESDCRKCKPGRYANLKCNNEHDTICAPCPDGTYTVHENVVEQCHKCSECGHGSYIAVPCSRTSDTQCEECFNAKDKTSIGYKTNCLNDGSNIMLSDVAPALYRVKNTELSDEGSGEEEEDDSKIIIGPGIALKPTSSSENVLDNTSISNKNISSPSSDNDIEDGSGETPLDVEIFTVKPDEPETSPSTKMVEETTTEETTILKSTVPNTVKPLPDDAVSDNLIPLTTSISKPSVSGTKEPAIFKPLPRVTTISPSKTTTTKTRIITLDPKPTTSKVRIITLGPGIELSDKPKKNLRKGNIHHTVNEKSDAQLSVGAQEMGDDSNKVTVGVVVAVAVVAAVVFFVLGFIASRYCRRKRHSFQVMKKVDGPGSPRNGGVPVPINVEYRDPDGHPQTGIYDEIDRNGKPMKPVNEEIIPSSVEDVYAVPNKVKKGQESPVIEAQLDRIKFIDETTDEEFGGRDDEKMGLLGTIERDLKQKKSPNGSLPHVAESVTEADADSKNNPEETVTSVEDEDDTADGASTSEDSYVINEKSVESPEDDEENNDESSPMLTNKEDKENEDEQ